MINLIIEKAKTPIEKADILNVLVMQYTVQGQLSEAIEAGKKGLQYLGVVLPKNNLDEALEIEVIKANKLLEGKEIATLINQADMTLPDKILATQLLTNIEPACYLIDQHLYSLVVLKALNLCLEYGNSAESINGYSTYGLLLGAIWGKYQTGYEFGNLALNISEKYNNKNQKSKACFLFAIFQILWVKHIKLTNDIVKEGFKAGIESGDLQYCGYILAFQLFNILHEGINIEKLLGETNKSLDFISKNQNQLANDISYPAKLCLLNLNGETKDLLNFDSPQLSEREYLKSCWQRKSYMLSLIHI